MVAADHRPGLRLLKAPPRAATTGEVPPKCARPLKPSSRTSATGVTPRFASTRRSSTTTSPDLPAQRGAARRDRRRGAGQVIDDIEFVQAQVRAIAPAQLESLGDFEIETLPGVLLGQKNVPVQAAGAYVPGGHYPLLASAHMTIVTAKVAGVSGCGLHPADPRRSPGRHHRRDAAGRRRRDLPARRRPGGRGDGTRHRDHQPGQHAGRSGNAYVAEAKRQLFGEVGIDLFAGPTEVLIVADDTPIRSSSRSTCCPRPNTGPIPRQC